MRLRGGAQYRSLLDTLEAKTRHIEPLLTLDIPVDVRVDFLEFGDESRSQTIGVTPAMYRKSHKTVFINNSTFAGLDADVQEAVLMHEMGHADRHARAADNLSMGEECIEADLFACRWGFGEALIKMRRRDYGDDYAQKLSLHTADQEAARAALKEWRFQRLFGLP